MKKKRFSIWHRLLAILFFGILVVSGALTAKAADTPSEPPASPTLSSIAITTPATKLNYTVGDALDISGLVITGTYSDNTTQPETITSTNISGFDSSAPVLNQVLTITDGTQTTTYTVNINAALAHISLAATVDVPASCNATDTEGVAHTYNTPNSYLAICALEAALQNGSISSVQLSNQFPSLGLFVTGINNVAADPNSQYWALYQNGNFANSGLTSLPVVAGDAIMLQLHDFSDADLGDRVTINVHAVGNGGTSGNGGSGSGGGASITSLFSVPNAISYLQSVQSSDGSFGSSSLYSDWAGIAIGAAGAPGTIKTNLLSYMSLHNAPSTLLTDNERHVMALLALGQNPYAFNGTNYIIPIINKFDGTQFGDPSLVNDDIFALIPLSASGYSHNDEIISKDIAFVISKQQGDGSWNTDIDFTAAAIQALSPFHNASGVSDALLKASAYLQHMQKTDGGFGNISSSSWAIQAMSVLGGSWANNGKTTEYYLSTKQATDGAASPSSDTIANRIWVTSYAIPAALSKPWREIMQSVSKPGNSNNISVPEASTLPTPTSTDLECMSGDLFSVVTGLPCSSNASVNPPTPSPVTTETSQTPKHLLALSKNNPITTLVHSPLLPGDTSKNIVSDNTLTATAGNALPSPDTPKNLPLILGTVSGLILLYAAIKFWFLK